MNINSNVDGDLSLLINDYHQQTPDSLAHLSSNLKNTYKRIQFEEWLVNSFSSETAIYKDFDWNNKVLNMLVINLVQSNPSAESQRREDHLLAGLISKAFPLEADEGSMHSKANSVHQTGLPIINTNLISQEMKEVNLPLTSAVLIKRALEDKNVLEILDEAIFNNNIALIKTIIQQHPIAFKEALLLKDIEGNTPVALALINRRSEILKIMIPAALDEFKSTLTMQNNEGHTPVALAVGYYLPDELKLIHDCAPEEFRNCIITKAKDGFTPVAIAVSIGSFEMINFMAKVANKQVNEAMILQDIDGNTPVIAAVLNLEMLKLITNVAPEGFRKALTLRNFNGDTAVALAARNIIMLKCMYENAPDEFKVAIALRDTQGISVLDVIKRSRNKNYSQIIELFKKNSGVRIMNKEIVNRKALGHAWNISGMTFITPIANKNTFEDISLEGWFAPQWCHMLSKDFVKFKNLYSDLLSDKDMDIFKEALDLGANPDSYSLQEKLQRIKKGNATIISTGYVRHEVTLLIWGDKFIICNRGGASRRPIEFFHFDPEKLDLSDLRKILSLEKSTKEQYAELFFKKMPEKLAFLKTELDIKLELNSEVLPDQIVGNCSFVSPITAIYAINMLKEVYGIDQEGRLLIEQNQILQKEETSESSESILLESINKSTALYQTWLAFEQITILERSIRPLETRTLHFEPDHAIIYRGLRKAHILELDDIMKRKLNNLTDIYMNFIDLEDQAELKIDLAFWNTIKKMPIV